MQTVKYRSLFSSLEKDTFIQIIMGVKPITYFDTFVQEWYEQGGEELTEQIRRSNPGE